MKTYRIVISYTVTEEAFIEANSEEDAREKVLSGEIDCDWSTIATDNWDLWDVAEAVDIEEVTE